MAAISETRRLVLPPPGERDGVEGFDVVAADGSVVGEALAVNRQADGLTLLVAPAGEPGSVIAVPAGLVAELRDVRETIALREGAAEALAASPRVARADLPAGGQGLLRAIPAELLQLVPVESTEHGSTSWVLALVLGAVASISLVVAHFVAEHGGVAWAFMAVPALLFVASGAVFLRGVDASLADKLRLVPASLLGYTPRQQRRR